MVGENVAECNGRTSPLSSFFAADEGPVAIVLKEDAHLHDYFLE